MIPDKDLIEHLLRKGDAIEAEKILGGISKGSIPKKEILDYAGFYRRIGNYKAAIALLNPYVRTSFESKATDASAELMIEYAANLHYLGASDEALKILNTPAAKHLDEALLYSTYIYFRKWENKNALIQLKSYLKSDKLTEYQRLVGQLNLASCYVTLGLDRTGISLANQIIEVCLNLKHEHLAGNAYGILASSYIGTGDFKSAGFSLKQAKKYLKNLSGPYHLVHSKWQAVIELLKNPSSNSISAIANIKKDIASESRGFQLTYLNDQKANTYSKLEIRQTNQELSSISSQVNRTVVN
jgi:tetratricopeptide (TPR) repeat protein